MFRDLGLFAAVCFLSLSNYRSSPMSAELPRRITKEIEGLAQNPGLFFAVSFIDLSFFFARFQDQVESDSSFYRVL
jgi:hypothetical protein